MTERWREFWERYRGAEAQNEDDLFYQVGKTVNRVPIGREVLSRMVRRIAVALDLNATDDLMDLCCGNGLITFELAPLVRQITAVDFSTRLIATARRMRPVGNIRYVVGDVLDPIPALAGLDLDPLKFLMSDSLAYLEPLDLERVLKNVGEHAAGRPFRFLLTGIPDILEKWSFYDTPERRARHVESERTGDQLNDGLGRWWHRSEIEEACARYSLRAQVAPQPAGLSSYRMDVLITYR
jgi:SAM-dependent methyltransferase